MNEPRLIFFDIDATLITTGGVGKSAMHEAGRALHGPDFKIDGISFAGRLDPLLLQEMLRLNGRPEDHGSVRAMFDQYRRILEARLREPIRGGPLPGVMDLLNALSQRTDVVLGLLTGNFSETGAMKLRACGIDPELFPIQVWGSDSPRTPPSRDDLPAVGMERFHRRTGRAINPAGVTIIGDTPLDIRCARANGCRSLGVATGQYAVPVLKEAGADHALANLADTTGVLNWLVDRG